MTNKAGHIDTTLLKLAATGDEPSFRALYDYFSPAIYRTAYRYLRATELAEDVVQDTFLTLWANRSKIDKIDSLENYIFILARNQCFRMLKNKAILVSTGEGLFDDLSDEPEDTEDDQFILVNRAINRLPPQQKKVFEMAKLKGLSHDRISRELNLSPNTVNNHITAAFRSVRNYIRQSASEVFLLAMALFS